MKKVDVFDFFSRQLSYIEFRKLIFLLLKLNCSQSERKVAVILQRPLKEHALLSH